MATKEAFSVPSRNTGLASWHNGEKLPYFKAEVSRYKPKESEISRKPASSDLRNTISERRGSEGKNVWNRLQKRYDNEYPRNQERTQTHKNDRNVPSKGGMLTNIPGIRRDITLIQVDRESSAQEEMKKDQDYAIQARHRNGEQEPTAHGT